MFVLRSRVSAVELERDEWRRRAEAASRPRTLVIVRRGPLWVRLLAASWLVTLGLLVGGAAIPHANDGPALRENYPACISSARSDDPQGDRYQELVDALRACAVYG